MTSPAPVTGKTPLYELEYQLEGEPAFWYRQKWERLVNRLEAVLQGYALAPPAAADYAALVARVQKLEQQRARMWMRSYAPAGAAATINSGATGSTGTTWAPIVLTEPARISYVLTHRAGPNSGAAAGTALALSFYLGATFLEPQIVARTTDSTYTASGYADLAAGTYTPRVDVAAFTGTCTWTRSDLTLVQGVAG